MKHCLRTLLAVLLAISLTLTGMALAEEELELGLAVEGPEEMEALPALALEDGALAVDGAALVTEDVATNAEGDEIVAKIDKANFPAADFRKYVLANIDADGDKKLSRSEADGVTELMLRTYEDTREGRNAYNLSTLKGVEYFENLEQLECVDCKVKALDVSKNTKLLTLNCSENRLAALDLGNNTELEELACQNNKLEKLNVSKNTRLIELNCGSNGLRALDTRANTELELLNAIDNRLTALDISRNAKLEFLYTNGNPIRVLDLKHNRILRDHLKKKLWKEKSGVYWSYEGDSDTWGLGIDYATILTSGRKMLYEGR